MKMENFQNFVDTKTSDIKHNIVIAMTSNNPTTRETKDDPLFTPKLTMFSWVIRPNSFFGVTWFQTPSAHMLSTTQYG